MAERSHLTGPPCAYLFFWELHSVAQAGLKLPVQHRLSMTPDNIPASVSRAMKLQTGASSVLQCNSPQESQSARSPGSACCINHSKVTLMSLRHCCRLSINAITHRRSGNYPWIQSEVIYFPYVIFSFYLRKTMFLTFFQFNF